MFERLAVLCNTSHKCASVQPPTEHGKHVYSVATPCVMGGRKDTTLGSNQTTIIR